MDVHNIKNNNNSCDYRALNSECGFPNSSIFHWDYKEPPLGH